MTSEQLLVIIGSLTTISLGLVAWIGNSMVSKLENISKSLQKIEKDFGILNNDHSNLKEDVKDIKQRVKDLEEA
jgi:hypothetical protein